MSINKPAKHFLKHSLVMKLTLGMSFSIILVCFIVLRYVNDKSEKEIISGLKKVNKTIATEYASKIKNDLDEKYHNQLFLQNILNSATTEHAKYDINLSKYNHPEINNIPDNINYFLVNDELNIILHSNNELVGSKYNSDNGDNNILKSLTYQLKTISDKIVDFEHYSNKKYEVLYTILVPFNVRETGKTLLFGMSIPISELLKELQTHKTFYNRFMIIATILIIIASLIFSIILTEPLKASAKMISQFVNKNIEESHKIKIKRKTENYRMVNMILSIIDKFKKVLTYAQNITDEDLKIESHVLNSNDYLTKNVLEMRNSLIKANQEESKRRVDQQQKNWHTQGLNIFSMLFRQNNDNLHKLTSSLITKLVEYLEVQSGAIYLLENIENQEVLKLYAPCGLPLHRLQNDTVQKNEGPVGTCFVEKAAIYMDDITSDFTTISSGLGKSKPASILVTPLIANDNIIGVMELESFKTIEDYKIAFVEAIQVPIASTISNSQTNQRTADLLRESESQFKELTLREKELRNNIIDLATTQELASQNETKQLNIINSIIDAVIYAEYDISGTIINANDNFSEFYKHQVIGEKIDWLEQTDIDFWSDVLKGTVVVRETSLRIRGRDSWLREEYIPIKDQYDNITSVINISADITEIKQKEQKIEELKERIQSIIQKNLRKQHGAGKENPLITLEDILNNTQTGFKYLNLANLTDEYNKDTKEVIKNIVKYKETIPRQIYQLKKLAENDNWESLKSRAVSLQAKVTYLGINEISEILNQFEKANLKHNLEKEVYLLINKIQKIWEEASNEINCIDLTIKEDEN